MPWLFAFRNRCTDRATIVTTTPTKKIPNTTIAAVMPAGMPGSSGYSVP